jgi:hypothetical protein
MPVIAAASASGRSRSDADNITDGPEILAAKTVHEIVYTADDDLDLTATNIKERTAIDMAGQNGAKVWSLGANPLDVPDPKLCSPDPRWPHREGDDHRGMGATGT